MEQERVLQPCIICRKPKAQGIRICYQMICEECETEIVNTEVSDERYPYFIHQMRQIWYKESS